MGRYGATHASLERGHMRALAAWRRILKLTLPWSAASSAPTKGSNHGSTRAPSRRRAACIAHLPARDQGRPSKPTKKEMGWRKNGAEMMPGWRRQSFYEWPCEAMRRGRPGSLCCERAWRNFCFTGSRARPSRRPRRSPTSRALLLRPGSPAASPLPSETTTPTKPMTTPPPRTPAWPMRQREPGRR